MLTFSPKWLDGATSHALNSEAAVRAVFKRIKIEKGSTEWAMTVVDLVNDSVGVVNVYKGVHQDKYF